MTYTLEDWISEEVENVIGREPEPGEIEKVVAELPELVSREDIIRIVARVMGGSNAVSKSETPMSQIKLIKLGGQIANPRPSPPQSQNKKEVKQMGKSVWKGSVSIGLVNIPISLQTAVRENKVSFNQITPCCGTKVNQQLKCQGCGTAVDRKMVKKGWDLGNGKFIVLEQSEVEGVRLKSVKSIEIEGFVPSHFIDPIQLHQSYYVVPEEGAEKAYYLISEALFMTGLFALARITTRGKEYTAIVRAKHKGQSFYLVFTTLYYPEEVLTPPELPAVALSEKERELGKQLLEGYTIENVDLTQYKNRYLEALKELISAKVLGQPLPTPIPEAQATTADLTKALEVSVKQRVKSSA